MLFLTTLYVRCAARGKDHDDLMLLIGKVSRFYAIYRLIRRNLIGV